MNQLPTLQQLLEQDIGQLHVALRRTELERDELKAQVEQLFKQLQERTEKTE